MTVRSAHFAMGFTILFAAGVFAGLGYAIWSMIEKKHERAARPVPEARYHVSSVVKTRIGGYRGQVIAVRCWPGQATCYYDVRFAATQAHTNTTLWGSDGPIEVRPLAIVESMREYELDAVES